MQSSSTTEHKHHVLESKIFLHRAIEDMTGNSHQLPAQLAQGSTLTACPYLIVVVDINIEHKLSLEWGVGCSLLWDLSHDCTDIDFQWALLVEHPTHLLTARETNVAFVNLAAVDVEGEVELAVLQCAWLSVGKPLTDEVGREEVLVVQLHRLFVHEFDWRENNILVITSQDACWWMLPPCGTIE